jgi:hypothetical protein
MLASAIIFPRARKHTPGLTHLMCQTNQPTNHTTQQLLPLSEMPSVLLEIPIHQLGRYAEPREHFHPEMTKVRVSSEYRAD